MFVAILFILIGIGLILYPYLSNYFYSKDVEDDKEEFIESTVADSDDNELLEKLYEELKRRNEELFASNQENLVDPFSYEQVTIDLSEYGIYDNTIGYINIPKMNIDIPILLGANTENMQKGATHMTETSYPIGGENTNSVIAAHRGWYKSKMFRNIDKLEIGDVIYIQNFREELVYYVYDIKIIEPTDLSELKIEEGEDIITLITCHPYLINTHRYIVKAARGIKE